MPRQEKPIYFDPSRFDLEASGDVSVGAYARRQRRRQILIGSIGALLIAGAAVVYVLLRPYDNAAADDRYPIRTQCQACGYRDTFHVPHNQSFPMKCPSCGEVAVQPIWRCRACGHEFVPAQRGAETRCPICGSERVGSAVTP